MNEIKIKCLLCGKIIDHGTCGCPNCARITKDGYSAMDMTKVIEVKSKPIKYKPSDSDIAFQESRSRRKVRKLDFEVR